MILVSALYYPASLSNHMGLVRDNRFYPGKASECWPVWWQYVRRSYPDLRIVLFADRHSPIPIGPLLDRLGEPWDDMDDHGRQHPRADEIDVGISEEAYDRQKQFQALRPLPRVHIRWLDAHAGQYFRPMQRNLVEAICLAYRANEDLFYLDNDAFLATDIRPFVRDADVVAARIAHHQMTMDSVCFYLSRARLHALDELGIDLPAYLTTMLNGGPVETRMHSLQEGGLYKMFCYGNTRRIGHDIELSHLSCLPNFLTFLHRNPINTPEYYTLLAQIESLDITRLVGVDITFPDMLCPEEPA